jgi:3-oxoacyl-[acyl-carrier protein] reductase
MSLPRLQGRVAIVTGAARGIGKATAKKLLEEGASVVLVDILSEALSGTLVELKKYGSRASGQTVNITRREEVLRMVEDTLARFGSIDVLVNNAGIVRPAPLESVRSEDWDAVVEVNLKGTFLCVEAVAPTMKAQRRGSIVNIGSRAALGKTERAVYSATKAGLLGLTRTLALELAPYSITVNWIGPGAIATELFRTVCPDESETTKALVSAIPLKRMGRPEDVANLICFLASEEASFITGQTIYICGGLSIGAH